MSDSIVVYDDHGDRVTQEMWDDLVRRCNESQGLVSVSGSTHISGELTTTVLITIKAFRQVRPGEPQVCLEYEGRAHWLGRDDLFKATAVLTLQEYPVLGTAES